MKLVINGFLTISTSMTGSIINIPVAGSPFSVSVPGLSNSNKYSFELKSIEIVEDKKASPNDLISIPLSEFSTFFFSQIMKYTADKETIESIEKVRKFLELLDMSSTIGRGNNNDGGGS